LTAYFQEVFYDLTWNLAHDIFTLRFADFPDSRQRFTQLTVWARDFCERYEPTDFDWNGLDYIATVDEFYEEKIREMFTTAKEKE
jgi:hypothetical protein